MDIRNLISQMTLKEKLGQLSQYNANLFLSTTADITGPMTSLGLSEEDLNAVGSVLNFSCADETIEIQNKHLANDRHKIPMLFMMDVIHGYRTIYPIPLALGCSFDTDLVAECSKMAAKEASAGGIHVTFTPMVDYVRDARWGRVMETCGEEPMLNAMMGAAQVKAFQGDDLKNPDNIATCVKHFAAYGGAEAGRDYNTVELGEHVLREYYLPAYKACIDAGTTMLMPSFNSLNGVPAIANKWLMQKILKDEWGFEGVVISDYNAIGELRSHGVAEDGKHAARLAFANGCDIEMCSSTYLRFMEDLLNEGICTMEQVDAAVERVLTLKDRLGLFEDPSHGGACNEKENAVCLTPEHRAIARKAATECAVLLKNENVLPFDPTLKKIAVIGPFAEENKIIGFWACRGDEKDAITVAEGIRAALPNAEITVARGCGNEWNDLATDGFAEALQAAENADAVILCLGEPQDYSGEGNCRTDLRLPGVQSELAKQVIAANPNTAVVLFNGRPLVLSDIEPFASAILDVWFPGTEGGNAVADMLFGKESPSGKLTMSFPKSVGQCPIYYNHPSTGRPKSVKKEGVRTIYNSGYVDCGNLPLYPFGYGLSYGNFVYEGMTLSADQLDKNGAIDVSVRLTNDSDIAAKETVQLYLRDLVASTVRPIQQLVAFEKVAFAPHETKEIRFTVTEPMLRFWNDEHQFVSESGKFNLSTGHADNLLFTTEFTLQ